MFDRVVYRGRTRIERLVGRLKQYRRIATCYDKRVRKLPRERGSDVDVRAPTPDGGRTHAGYTSPCSRQSRAMLSGWK